MVHITWKDAFKGKGEQVWLIHSSTQKYVQWGSWQWSGPEYRTSEAVCLLRGSYHLMFISLSKVKTSCIACLHVSPGGFGFVSVMKGTVVSSALQSFRLTWRKCKQQRAVHSFCWQMDFSTFFQRLGRDITWHSCDLVKVPAPLLLSFLPLLLRTPPSDLQGSWVVKKILLMEN